MMGRKILFLLILAWGWAGSAWGAEVSIPLWNGLRLPQQAMSWTGIRDKGIIKQKFDYSCGSGALATLMQLVFGEKVSEEEIIDLILEGKTS